MNIEYGAVALERLGKEGLIQVPTNLTTFTLDTPPDFERLFGDVPFSVYLGTEHQGWMNGSLAERLTLAHYRTDGVKKPTLVVKRHNLTPRDMPEFFDDTLSELEIKPWRIRKEDVIGVVYKTWSDVDIDESYFVEVTKTPSGIAYSLQLVRGNTNGWNFNPYSSLHGSEEDFGEAYREILNQATIAHQYVSRQIPSGIIVVEGKVTNKGYLQEGPMAIDLYEGYPHPADNSLGHRELIRSFLQTARK